MVAQCYSAVSMTYTFLGMVSVQVFVLFDSGEWNLPS